MKETKLCHLGTALSITTGKMVTPGRMEAIYMILSWMTGDDVMTHQIPRFIDECRPWLLRRHPFLADIDAANVTKENYRDWLAQLVEKHGAFIDVERIPREDHKHIDPIQEAISMFGKDKIITVNLGEDGTNET